MTVLRITVRWPDGTYNGKEWPPSPLRLFQAMIAGYRTGRNPDSDLDAAMRHVETLPPATIYAPCAEPQAPVAASVPNNDGDVILNHLAKGRPEKARDAERSLRTIRVRRPWRFDGPVTYDWTTNGDTAPHLTALQSIAASLFAVGHGTDLANACVEVSDRIPPAGGLRYRPTGDGRRHLTVPYPGVFDVLEKRYQNVRGQVGAGSVRGVAEPLHRSVGYRSDLDMPPIRFEAFSLRSPDDRPWSMEGARGSEVAAMVRHAIGNTARRAGLPNRIVSELMGHGGDSRIHVQPLPNVGHLYADGRIRRVMLCAPASIEGRHWEAVIHRLRGAELVPHGEHEPVAVLTAVAADDKLISRFTGTSRKWTTATPIVLPGHDHRRGRARPARTARRMLRHADVPEPLLSSVTVEPAPRLRGSYLPGEYQVPRHLERFPREHLTFEWSQVVDGPLAFGAGVGYGLGLLLPTK